MNANSPQTDREVKELPAEISSAIRSWGNSIFRPTVPTNLIEKCAVTDVGDERAKLLTAEFLYGERKGTEKEIPHDDSEITNRTDNLREESLWLYGGGLSKAPAGFSPGNQSDFDIPTGKTKKCSKCKGAGEVNCWLCKGTGQDKSHTCNQCNGKGCRYCNGTGKATKDCSFCKGSGKKCCGNCEGYKYVQIVIQVTTRFQVQKTKEHDYQGEVPPKKLKNTTGAVIFQEIANYPEEGMRKMLKGGIDRQEYTQLQSGLASVFHSLIDKKIQEYDGNINLVHGLVDNFFKQIPDAFKENRVLEREILPVRLRMQVEDVPVKKVSYLYKEKPYCLWVYGKEGKVYAKKRPFAVTTRLVVQWIIQLILVGLIIHWIAGSKAHHASDSQPTSSAPADDAITVQADSYEKDLQAAEQGNPEAQTRLGVMYAKGNGIAKDPTEAVKWFAKAAEQGNARAQNNLGLMYDNGNGTAKDTTLALTWFKKAANQGFAQAQNNLGTMYGEGDGVAADPTEATKWFTKAAEQGLALAQNNLALAYAKGEGVAKNTTEAVNWFTKAAEQGFVNAQNNLGVMYDDGTGVIKSDGEAVKWFRKAAEQGFARAQNNLATKYLNGEGVAKNLVEAAKWFNLAATQGNVEAKNQYDELVKKMTPEEIVQAQKLAGEFVPKPNSQ